MYRKNPDKFRHTKFAAIVLKLNLISPYSNASRLADRIANSVNPDHAAPAGAV